MISYYESPIAENCIPVKFNDQSVSDSTLSLTYNDDIAGYPTYHPHALFNRPKQRGPMRLRSHGRRAEQVNRFVLHSCHYSLNTDSCTLYKVRCLILIPFQT